MKNNNSFELIVIYDKEDLLKFKQEYLKKKKFSMNLKMCIFQNKEKTKKMLGY